MKNPIFTKINNNRLNYCHALEVYSVYELECIVESLVYEFNNDGFKEDMIIEFFETMSIYALDASEEEEEEIYNFDITNYIKELF